MVDSGKLAEQVCELQNVGQFIADSIEKMILEGSLRPGDRLVQTEIADKFGVSRLPVRDAFKILEKKELIVTLPRKGMIVRPITTKEIDDIFELRLLLESYALAKSLPRLTESDMTEIAGIIEQQKKLDASDFLNILEIDEKFHYRLWSKCDNNEITKQLLTVWRRIKVLRTLARTITGWNVKSIENHIVVLQALQAKDFTAAREYLERGIKRSHKEILEVANKIK